MPFMQQIESQCPDNASLSRTELLWKTTCKLLRRQA